MATAKFKPRILLYFALNLAFAVMLLLAHTLGGSSDPRIVYLILLFALCSSSVIDLDGLNGRYSLLGMFLAAYFVFYGFLDVTLMLNGSSNGPAEPPLNQSELLILVGGIVLLGSYRAIVSLSNGAMKRQTPSDWSIPAILLVGGALWSIGTYTMFFWHVHIVTDTTTAAVRSGFAKESPLSLALLILAQMMQPLGELLLVYAWRITRRSDLALLVVSLVVLQVVLGFIIDIKGIAMFGGIIVIVSCVLIDGKIPKTWVAAAAFFILFAFPVFQAYRAQVHGHLGMSRAAVVENFGNALQIALSAKEKVNSGPNRAQAFFERVSLKGSVEMIVKETGNTVQFQNGASLTPILAAFVPKIIWPKKPDVQTGRIVNRVFHVSDDPDTYISPSHLGELYWNFGWPGVIIGMSVIGSLLGFTARFNLAEGRTVTRLLVTVLAIQYLINGFEGAIAVSYVVWLRSMAVVALLHLIFSRNTVSKDKIIVVDPNLTDGPSERAYNVTPFPNLLR